jgi:hypothetical protein
MPNESVCLEMVPRPSEDVIWRNIAGEVVIADRDNGTIRVLNKTASAIWCLLDGTNDISDIASKLSNTYDTSPETARQDSLDFCRQLLEGGLLSVKGA